MNKLIQINPSLLVSVQFVELKMVFPLKINFFSFSFFFGKHNPPNRGFRVGPNLPGNQTNIVQIDLSQFVLALWIDWAGNLPIPKIDAFFFSSECKKSSS